MKKNTSILYINYHNIDLDKINKFIENNPDIKCIVLNENNNLKNTCYVINFLKTNFATSHIPIIYIKHHKTNYLQLNKIIRAGIDDFIQIPISKSQLESRIRLNIKRAQRDQNLNPLTKLPGNIIINQIIKQKLNQQIAILYADIDNFKMFNDKYGFNQGNKIIKKTAKFLSNTIKQYKSQDAFLGHIGGDDFIIITSPTLAFKIDKTIHQNFKKNNNLTISTVIITNEKQIFASINKISQTIANLMHKTKAKNNKFCYHQKSI